MLSWVLFECDCPKLKQKLSMVRSRMLPVNLGPVGFIPEKSVTSFIFESIFFIVQE